MNEGRNMNDCEKEQAVYEALTRGHLDETLQDHLKDCSVCSDVVAVTGFLQREARAARLEARKSLPSPDLVWWKAQMLSKRAATERATRPIAIVEKAAYATGAFGLVGLTVWNWTTIQRWLEPLRTTLKQMSSLGEAPLLNPFLYMGAGFFVLILLMVFALYVVWAEQ
jgi:hypothetical protein